jgi:hypothetical protein
MISFIVSKTPFSTFFCQSLGRNPFQPSFETDPFFVQQCIFCFVNKIFFLFVSSILNKPSRENTLPLLKKNNIILALTWLTKNNESQSGAKHSERQNL